jgi:hypothetical protein
MRKEKTIGGISLLSLFFFIFFLLLRETVRCAYHRGYGSIAGPVEVEYKSDIQDPQKIGLLALN